MNRANHIFTGSDASRSPQRAPACQTGVRIGRRESLRRLGGLTAAAFAASADLLSNAASAATDYKALVGVFLFGGMDGNSLLVPLDTAGYGRYAAVRTAASGVQLTQAELLPIAPRNAGTLFGLHPALVDLPPLFEAGSLALLANVGTLAEPTTRAQYAAGQRPANLYSHSDQQAQWQTAATDGAAAIGWGGRLADIVQSGSGFPVATSTAGINLFVTGATTSPLAIPATGSFGLSDSGSGTAGAARLAAFNALRDARHDHALVAATADITRRAQALSAIVNPILGVTSPTLGGAFAGLTTGLARQLLAVAKLIEARAVTGAKRQVFLVSLGGFDTHGGELATLRTLFGEVGPALAAFHAATWALGVAEQVTTFTLSDFGRTFQPSSGAGTDHAWGSHHLVLGGAVRGGRLYGAYPELVLGGPDDAEREGRWVPTTSVDQYGATLARWFGVPDASLAAVFPNLARFPVRDLGFVG